MNITYDILPEEEVECCRDICNELMVFQKSKAYITPELFNTMNFETRMIPSIKKALHNYIVVVKDDDQVVGYVYSNIRQRKHIQMTLRLFLTCHPLAEKM